jgi:hypothetical protein
MSLSAKVFRHGAYNLLQSGLGMWKSVWGIIERELWQSTGSGWSCMVGICSSLVLVLDFCVCYKNFKLKCKSKNTFHDGILL